MIYLIFSEFQIYTADERNVIFDYFNTLYNAWKILYKIWYLSCLLTPWIILYDNCVVGYAYEKYFTWTLVGLMSSYFLLNVLKLIRILKESSSKFVFFHVFLPWFLNFESLKSLNSVAVIYISKGQSSIILVQR